MRQAGARPGLVCRRTTHRASSQKVVGVNLRDLKKLGANRRRNLHVVRESRPRVTESFSVPPSGDLTLTRTAEVGDGAAAICPWCSACVAVNGDRQMTLVRTRGARCQCGECGEWMLARFDSARGGRP